MSGQIATTNTATRLSRQTMKAMVRQRYGPAAEVQEVGFVPVPEIGPGEVLVEVHSSSVNAREWHLMNGKPYVIRSVCGLTPRTPILGADVSGVVLDAGPGVSRFRPGDEVFGEVGAGGHAEYVAAKDARAKTVVNVAGIH